MIPFLREPTRVYALDGSGRLVAEITFPETAPGVYTIDHTFVRLVAEITFPETAPGVYTIDHTFVDASLRGQGVADRLVRAALEQIQANGGTAAATCSYAAAWLDKHPQ